MRLIDADALENLLGISDEDIMFQEMLRDAPTVDAVEVIHAHWIGERGYLVHECSNCHKEFQEAEDDYGCDFEVLDFDYCPHCGAKMDEEDGDSK